jgi:peptide/nickel transport system permease protein
MDQVVEESLGKALDLIKKGKPEEAGVILARLLAQDPQNERGWHILSYALTDRDKQVYALQRVLQINPDNKAARAQLARIYSVKMASKPAPTPTPRPVASFEAPVRTTTRLSNLRRVLADSPSLVVGSLLILAFLLVAAAAPLIAPPTGEDNPYLIPKHGFQVLPQPPSREHPLGLMSRQYDVLYGLVWGTRTALKLGLLVMLGRLLIGGPLGLFSGHYGRLVDAAIMRVTDAFMALPIVAAVMVTLALFAKEVQAMPGGRMLLMPTREEQVLILTLVAFGWMPYARLVRGNVLSEREKEYMQAARAIGAGNSRAIFRHLLPNVTQGMFVLSASDIGAVVVLITAFTFIGLVQPSTGQMEADWGQMLSASRDWIIGGSPSNAFKYWYTYLPVSAAIVLFSMGWSMIGDGLRDIMDPRLRKGSPSLAGRG